MNIRAMTLSCAVAALSCAGSAAAFAADANGVWMNDTGRGAIEIKDCGGKLCGHVVWTRDESDTSRGCGKQIIGEAESVGNGLWDNGWIYSPDKKRRYDVELKPLADGTLRVKGYAGTKLFSKTMIWTPAAADLKRCDATNVEAKSTGQTKTETVAVAKPLSSPPAPIAVAKPLPPAVSATQALAATEAAKSSEPARPSIAPQPEVKPDAKGEAKADATSASKPEQTSEPRVAQADSDDDADEGGGKGDLLEKLDGMEFGDGYGVKKLSNGDCRVKLPYVKITVPCKK